jgi:hypothetical protein
VKRGALHQLINAAGARLWFLPPYFARPQSDRAGLLEDKALDAQCTKPHHRPYLAIGKLVETIQPDESQNYLTNAGYGSVKR